MRINSLTDKGRKRKDNQDTYWVARLNDNGQEASIICLCDGMGGLKNGAQASHTVVSAIRKTVIKYGLDTEKLQAVIQEANRRIYSLSNGDKSKAMGTTCTIVICEGGRYRVLHVGDSRCYLLHRDGKLDQITTDHSAVREYKVTKQNNPKLYAKYRNLLTRCIGVFPEVQLDTFTGTYEKGDEFFVCCDGCWHYFDEVAGYHTGDFDNLRVLFDKCMDAGETDNITAATITI